MEGTCVFPGAEVPGASCEALSVLEARVNFQRVFLTRFLTWILRGAHKSARLHESYLLYGKFAAKLISGCTLENIEV